MKSTEDTQYPCNLIQDLLPLYHDVVCSRESSEATEKHLKECPVCREYYETMRDSSPLQSSADGELELRKAASFVSVKKRLFKKQLLITAVCVILLLSAALLSITALKQMDQTIAYSTNLSVTMTDEGLIAQLKGNVWNRGHSKTITLEREGREQTCIFFCLTGTKWDSLITAPDSFTKYTVCPIEKGAGRIDHVYYYTGDYSGLEQLEADALQNVLTSSVLLWSRK